MALNMNETADLRLSSTGEDSPTRLLWPVDSYTQQPSPVKSKIRDKTMSCQHSAAYPTMCLMFPAAHAIACLVNVVVATLATTFGMRNTGDLAGL